MSLESRKVISVICFYGEGGEQLRTQIPQAAVTLLDCMRAVSSFSGAKVLERWGQLCTAVQMLFVKQFVRQAANYKLEAPQLVHGSQQRSPSPRWADMGADDP